MSTSSPLTSLTSAGLQVANLAQRVSQLTALIQAITGFGPNLNLDPDSIDGQTIGIFAESYNNIDQLIEVIWQSFNPNTATGAALSLLVQLNGITRQQGFYSTVTLSLTGNPGATVPEGSLVTASDGSSVWATSNDCTIGSDGNAEVEAQCTVLGPTVAGVGLLNQPTTPVFGWFTVTNNSAAVQGSLEETDAQLRARRALSTSTPAQGTTDAMYGALMNLSGVTQALVYENNTNTTDDNGVPAHSISIIVQGGGEQDILNTIWLKKNLGVGLNGSISGTVVDSQGNNHTIRYSTPTQSQVYIIINMTALASFPTTGVADLQAALAAWATANLGIGDNVIASQLYIPINSVPGVSVTSLFLGFAPAPTGTGNLTTAYNAISAIQAGNVTVNVTF